MSCHIWNQIFSYKSSIKNESIVHFSITDQFNLSLLFIRNDKVFLLPILDWFPPFFQVCFLDLETSYKLSRICTFLFDNYLIFWQLHAWCRSMQYNVKRSCTKDAYLKTVARDVYRSFPNQPPNVFQLDKSHLTGWMVPLTTHAKQCDVKIFEYACEAIGCHQKCLEVYPNSTSQCVETREFPTNFACHYFFPCKENWVSMWCPSFPSTNPTNPHIVMP